MENNDQERILSFNAYELQEYEPNRYPYLFIDRVVECVPGKYAKGYKNLTNNEWFFPYHYIGHPIMPAAIQIESLNQMFKIAFRTLFESHVVHITDCSCEAVFHREIYPGDRLDIEAQVVSFINKIGKGNVKSYVGGELACEIKTVVGIQII